MGSKRVAFKIIDSLPSRVGAVLGTIITLVAAAYPEVLRSWTDWLMSPDQIRFIGMAGLVSFAFYWFVWAWLRSHDVETSGAAQTTHGAGAHSIGSIGAVTFNSADTSIPIKNAAASQTIKLLASIERKYCRGSYVSLFNNLDLYETLQKNIMIIIGSKLGLDYIKREVYDQAQDHFEGGGTVMKTNISNFSSRSMPSLTLPPNEIVYVNFTKQAGEVNKELASLALSPFLADKISDSLDELKVGVDEIFTTMISFLSDRYESQRVRLIMSINDATVAAGLYNEFINQVITVESAIAKLRDAIAKELSNG